MLGIRKNDKVIVRSGKDKNKTGTVLQILREKKRAIVEGVNIVKKHMRKRSENSPSGIVERPASISISNLALYCTACKKGVRYSVKLLEDKTKIRTCKKCGASL